MSLVVRIWLDVYHQTGSLEPFWKQEIAQIPPDNSLTHSPTGPKIWSFRLPKVEY